MSLEKHNSQVQKTNKKRKSTFGKYDVVITKQIENKKEFETVSCLPLSQDEIADGWQTVLPRKNKSNPIHHWSVTLAQLPPHLWCKLKLKLHQDTESDLIYSVIKDKIYHYSVNTSEYDHILKELYLEVNRGYYANLNLINEYLSQIDTNINGWLIIKAKKLVQLLTRSDA
jgi:hypothetical protein